MRNKPKRIGVATDSVGENLDTAPTATLRGGDTELNVDRPVHRAISDSVIDQRVVVDLCPPEGRLIEDGAVAIVIDLVPVDLGVPAVGVPPQPRSIVIVDIVVTHDYRSG